MDPSEGRPYVEPSDPEELPPLYESVNSNNAEDTISPCCSNINRAWLPFKAFFFFFYGAIGALFPFIALYFKHLWLSPTQAGFLVGLRPIVQSVTGPFWAVFADKFNAKKIVLFIGLCGWLFSHTSLLLVPAGQKPLSCGDDSKHDTKRSVDLSYDSKHDTKRAVDLSYDLHNGIAHEKLNPRDLTYQTSNIPSDQVDANDQAIQSRLPLGQSASQKSPLYKKSALEDSLNISSEVNIRNPNQSKSSERENVEGVQKDSTWWTMSSNHVPVDTWRTFTYLCLIIFIGNMFSAPAQTMANTATLQALESETHKYGVQRCFGSIGWGVSAFVVGMLVSMNHDSSLACKGLDDINYSPCFYAFGVLMLGALVAATFFKFHNANDAHSQEKHRSALRFCQQIDCLTLFVFFAALLAGFNMGFIQTFLFWHLQTLGGTQHLFSLMTGFNAIGEMVGFLLSVKLISKYGHLKVLALGFFAYSIRLTIYGVIESPWWVLPVELLKAFTSSAVWASVMSYVGAGSQMGSTLPAMVHMLYWGLGYGGGGMLGGVLMQAVGARTVFLGLAVISLSVVILVLVIVHLDCCPKRKHDVYMPVQESEDEDDEHDEHESD